MTEEHDDLRAVGDSLVGDAERLREIEDAKAALPPDDPRFLQLSQEAEGLGQAIAIKTRSERELADEVAEQGRA